jgi:PHS family inorganic phosphate transporter-like MFS transporter
MANGMHAEHSPRPMPIQFSFEDLYSYFVREGNWYYLLGTSATWFVLDVSFYGMSLDNRGTLSDMWATAPPASFRARPSLLIKPSANNTVTRGTPQKSTKQKSENKKKTKTKKDSEEECKSSYLEGAPHRLSSISTGCTLFFAFDNASSTITTCLISTPTLSCPAHATPTTRFPLRESRNLISKEAVNHLQAAPTRTRA